MNKQPLEKFKKMSELMKDDPSVVWVVWSFLWRGLVIVVGLYLLFWLIYYIVG